MENFKSVVVFNPSESDEQTANKFIDWLRENKEAELSKFLNGEGDKNDKLYKKGS